MQSQENIIVLVVLDGAMFFAVDLMKEFDFDFRLETIKIKTFTDNQKALVGEAFIRTEIQQQLVRMGMINASNILIIEDIVDSGDTMSRLIKEIHLYEPASIQLISLLERKGQEEVFVDHRGFELDSDAFVYGYGLDNNNTQRHLKSIYAL